MKQKTRVGILFGGRSTEHEISIRSARSIVANLDPKRFSAVLLGIDKQGTWLDIKDSRMLLETGTAPKRARDLRPKLDPKAVDVVFPVLHGSYGEDGTMQGYLELLDVPFVGPGVLGSSVGMDKDMTKRILKEAGIAVAPGLVVRQGEKISFAAVTKQLGLPVFVKPANAGSSVGVSKVRTKSEFEAALREAFRYDMKVLVESAIVGREIECAVLGNEHPVVAVPGEIIPGEEFYSYADKYAATSASVSRIPAQLPAVLRKKIEKQALAAYAALGLEGLTRVDFFCTKNGMLYVNEVNTLPGFTSISMYPKMWEASGLPFPKLVEKLIELALLRQKRQRALSWLI